jgi:hypothetical protein
VSVGNSSYAGDVTGTYVARFTNASKMLQLVQTPAGTLSGQYEEAIVNQQGELQEQSFAVDGAANGNKITITIRPGVLSTVVSMFGSLDGDTLVIDSGFSDGSAHSETYKRDDSRAFAVQVEALRGLSQKVQTGIATAQAQDKAAREEQAFMTGLVALLRDLESFNATAEERLGMIKASGDRYPATTEKMSAALDYEKRIAGIQQASLKRSQIAVQLSQAEVQSETAHTSLRLEEDQLSDRIKGLGQRAQTAVMRCKLIDPALPSNVSIVETPNNIEHCRHLIDVERDFINNARMEATAVGDLEARYAAEERKEKAIVAEAEHIE